MSRIARFAEAERLRSDQRYVNWLISQGVDMSELDPAQARRIVRNMRRDSREAEEYYTRLFEAGPRPAARPGDQCGRLRGSGDGLLPGALP